MSHQTNQAVLGPRARNPRPNQTQTQDQTKSMHAIDCAVYIKTRLSETVQSLSWTGPHVPVEEWFVCTPSGDRTIRYEDIAAFSDDSFDKWMSVGDHRVNHVCDMEDKLRAWILSCSVEELACFISSTISMCDGDGTNPSFEFTPFQRLLMYVYTKFPVTCTSTVFLDSDDLRAIVGEEGRDASGTRRIPIQASRTLLKGSLVDVGLFNGPTATGKTAMSLAIAAMATNNENFPRMLDEYRGKQLSKVFDGTPDMEVARLVIVATGSSVFEHFVSTLHRLKPHIESSTDTKVEIWTKIGKKTSVKEAGERPSNVVVYWFIPVKRLGEVLRQTPDMGVAFIICDEFTVDPPRERSASRRSNVLKYLVPIATPHDLHSATNGRTFLSELFNGPVRAPRDLVRMIKCHKYSEAQHIADQLCQLELSTFTPFRNWLRLDLKELVPKGFRTIFVKSKRCTLSSFLLQSDTDLLPASPENVVFSILDGYRLTDESNVLIKDAFSGDTVDISKLDAALSHAVSQVSLPHYKRMFEDVVFRLRQRLIEFQTECPVCFGSRSNMRIFKCCGYVVCESCYERVNSTCFFCRMQVDDTVARSSVPTFLPSSPAAPLAAEEEDVPPNMYEDIKASTITTNTQLQNLANTFECLYRHDKKRVLMVVNSDGSVHQSEYSQDAVTSALRSTGFRAVVVDKMLNGKGTDFARFKTVFDSDDPCPIVLCCFTMASQLLIGTNLDRVDACVTVGSIPDKMLIQSLGRVFRPLASRDNTQWFPMIRIYS